MSTPAILSVTVQSCKFSTPSQNAINKKKQFYVRLRPIYELSFYERITAVVVLKVCQIICKSANSEHVLPSGTVVKHYSSQVLINANVTVLARSYAPLPYYTLSIFDTITSNSWRNLYAVSRVNELKVKRQRYKICIAFHRENPWSAIACIYIVSVRQTAPPLASDRSHLITAYCSFIDPWGWKAELA